MTNVYVVGIRKTADHFMFECERYTRLRYNLCQELNLITGKDLQSVHQFGWKTITGQDESLPQDMRCKIAAEVVQYLTLSKRFVV